MTGFISQMLSGVAPAVDNVAVGCLARVGADRLGRLRRASRRDAESRATATAKGPPEREPCYCNQVLADDSADRVRIEMTIEVPTPKPMNAVTVRTVVTVSGEEATAALGGVGEVQCVRGDT